MRYLKIFLTLFLILSLSSEVGLHFTGYLKDGSYKVVFYFIAIFSGILSSIITFSSYAYEESKALNEVKSERQKLYNEKEALTLEKRALREKEERLNSESLYNLKHKKYGNCI